ncbi:MAG: outer membrane protein assembly factor BamD [Bacteroidaceae bacterium]|nr:outer membrane protein assembly factor BamD [Bacteroidaceae bacterium]
MKKTIGIYLTALLLFSACSNYNTLLKSTDYEYKYEAAKEYYISGKYSKAASLLEELIAIMKGTDKGEESLYMLGMCYYGMGDYQTASHYFVTYYKNYPQGIYTEEARFHSRKTLYFDVPEPRLDQSSTIKAIQELQLFMEYYPQSTRKAEIQKMLFELQDNLVKKEYESALLYYKLGPYFLNSGSNGGNNYTSCIVTAQNALQDYPYTSLREELSVLILRARYQMALQSVEEKKLERLRETIDEYYAFKNEFPQSKHTKEVEDIMKDVSRLEEKLANKR